jgi:hypothetical protein
MTRNNEGKLSTEELREFDELSEKAHQLTLANARLLAAQHRALSSHTHAGIARRRIQEREMAQYSAPRLSNQSFSR